MIGFPPGARGNDKHIARANDKHKARANDKHKARANDKQKKPSSESEIGFKKILSAIRTY